MMAVRRLFWNTSEGSASKSSLVWEGERSLLSENTELASRKVCSVKLSIWNLALFCLW